QKQFLTIHTSNDPSYPVFNPNQDPTEPNVVLNPNASNPSNEVASPPAPQPFIVYVDGYTGRLGCEKPADNATVDAWSQAMQSGFDKDRLDIFKRKAEGYCLTVTQIRRLINVFSFDSYKMEFAKTALAHTYDLDNYMLLSSEFTFSSNKKDLNTYFNEQVANYVWKENYTSSETAVK